MALKLFAEKSNPQTWKLQVIAKFNDVNLEVVDSNLEAEAKKNVASKIPFLETEDGHLFGANAIARYIAKLGKNKLYGSSALEAANVEQWVDYSVTDIELPGAVWVYPILGIAPNSAAALQKAKGDIRKAMEALNKHLLTRTFLVGQRLSLADVVVAFALYRLYELVLDPAFRKSFVNTNRWYTTVVNQPEVKSIVPNVTLCEKMQVAKEAPAPAKEEEKPKKEKKEEKPKPKKEEKPKKEVEEEEDDPAAAEEREAKKKPNPLDSLPPSPFVLDDWKRTYSNEDTRSVAIPYFWNKLDKEGWSLWIGEYKYNHELEKLFMTCNLVGGFIQRLDKLRKYGFASIVILGDEASGMKISCCFLVRSQDMPNEMKEVDDVEHYEWKKITEFDDAAKEKVNQFWAWDMPGFNQGKIFK